MKLSFSRQNKHPDSSAKPEGANLSSESWIKCDKRQTKTIKPEDRIRHVRIRALANCERYTSPLQWAPAHVQSDTCRARRVRPNTLNANLFTLQPLQTATCRAGHLRAISHGNRWKSQGILESNQNICSVKNFLKTEPQKHQPMEKNSIKPASGHLFLIAFVLLVIWCEIEA